VVGTTNDVEGVWSTGFFTTSWVENAFNLYEGPITQKMQKAIEQYRFKPDNLYWEDDTQL
jgi:hypothetical protein